MRHLWRDEPAPVGSTRTRRAEQQVREERRRRAEEERKLKLQVSSPRNASSM
jgi:hypothetical protein